MLVPIIMPPRWLREDFTAGAEFSFGEATPTREEIIAFASACDPQPFHLDEGSAAAPLFGGLCASGWHTCALTMRMMVDAYLKDSASLGSPGIDELRWLKPVFPGDTLRVQMRVLQSRLMARRPGVGLSLQCWAVHKRHGQTVMTMQGWGMYRQRDASRPPASEAQR
jgi:acyl dehydratase